MVRPTRFGVIIHKRKQTKMINYYRKLIICDTSRYSKMEINILSDYEKNNTQAIIHT